MKIPPPLNFRATIFLAMKRIAQAAIQAITPTPGAPPPAPIQPEELDQILDEIAALAGDLYSIGEHSIISETPRAQALCDHAIDSVIGLLELSYSMKPHHLDALRKVARETAENDPAATAHLIANITGKFLAAIGATPSGILKTLMGDDAPKMAWLARARALRQIAAEPDRHMRRFENRFENALETAARTGTPRALH